MKRLAITLVLAFFALVQGAAQVWHNPESAGFPVIQGQAWQGEARLNFYDRFPARVAGTVRKPVWGLSRQNAGESLCFRTDAEEIKVRYSVRSGLNMPHMPSTGVSGVDLYAMTREGDEIFVGGINDFSSKDSVVYTFGKIDFRGKKPRKPVLYTLYLPLYNGVEQMEIGVENGAFFEFVPVRRERPIVCYGTSITQGACASRPAMAWTNILQRRLDRPVVNLGFSGNAKLETEVVSLVAELDPAVFLIDALPNLDYFTLRLKDTIANAVHIIRQSHPTTPVILADHCGYPHSVAIGAEAGYIEANRIQKEVYEELRAAGDENLYHCSIDDIALPQDATVEGVHSTDLGMTAYADAYEKLLREILREPEGDVYAARPRRQDRDNYDWPRRHQDKLAQGAGGEYDLVLIGDSITHFWQETEQGEPSWLEMMDGKALNLGFGYDRVENVLWRVYHGEADDLNAKRIVVLIGTNNLSTSTDEDILEGLELLWKAIAVRHPDAELVACGILPRGGEYGKRVAPLNKKMAKLARRTGVKYIDPGKKMLDKGELRKECFAKDLLHLSDAGYRLIAPEIIGESF
ncbi:MAG: SGNH/GDSL hydrolase family protein [Bacteroidales bacterium]|nr:SGNH/GDSL hydrolase family protein [Bacteroidales bacterium]